MPEPDEFLPPEDPLDGYEIREFDEFILALGPLRGTAMEREYPRTRRSSKGGLPAFFTVA